MGKGAGSVSIIGGADGPTSIFIAGKGGRVKFKTRIGNHFRKLERNRIKKRITANPHTLEEVAELLKGIPCNASPPGFAWGTNGFGAARRGKCGSLKNILGTGSGTGEDGSGNCR